MAREELGYLQDRWAHNVGVRIYGLKQEGGELFMKDFRKLWMYNEESQIKKLRKAMHKVVLIYFQKINQLFLRFNRLFLSTVNKNNLKQIYVWSGKERITQTDLY